ncbi:MAG: hypothetical protein WCE48_11545 [Steroidobacteraceae bacterium]
MRDFLSVYRPARLSLTAFAVLLLVCGAGCSGSGAPATPANIAKEITQFKMLGVDGAVAGSSIAVTVPYGTDVTALAPTIASTASVIPASGVPQDFSRPVVYTLIAADGSTKTYTVTVTVAPNSAKEISAFTMLGVDATVGASAIALTVPYGTSVTALSPSITITGASVYPASGAPQDFSRPVIYMVTAADGSTQTYTVTVSVALNSAKDITRFSILGTDAALSGDSVALTVPYRTDPSALTPTLAITGASVSPASGVPQNFTSPVTYTVTAANGSTKAYTVTVSVALNPAKDITAFSILGIAATVGANTVALTVPYGTSLTALTPTIAITGASVSPASGVPQNFTSPVTYTVTAANGSTKAYTVTVSVGLPSTNKLITAFDVSGCGSSIYNGDPSVGTIALFCSHLKDMTAITPTITITGQSVSPASGAAVDLSQGGYYEVTAQDSSVRPYNVVLYPF